MFIGSFSTRCRSSATDPAWIVDIEACPTEIAWKSVNASTPRTSPTMTYSGRWRSAATKRLRSMGGNARDTGDTGSATRRQAVTRAGDRLDPIFVVDLDFGSVLDGDYLVFRSDEHRHGVEECRLSRGSPARDQNRPVMLDEG